MADPRQELPDPAVAAIKVPPHSIEAERAVLGGLMLDNGMWEQIADRIKDSDFYRADHKILFRAIYDQAERGMPFDVITLSDWLKSHDLLEQAGGTAYLIELARQTPSATNVRAYADIVAERALLRDLIRTGGDLAGWGYMPEGRSVVELIDQAEQRVFALSERGTRAGRGFTPVSALLTAAVDRIDELFHAKNHVTGLATGITDFDERTAGLQPGDLVIIAGRPSMGKTSFAMNIAENVAISEKKVTAVFSMEMPAVQLAMRLLSSLGRIDQSKLRTGRLEDEDWPRITSAMELMSEAPLFIDDSAALSPMELRARARRLKREHGLGLIVIDYLQLMQVPGTRENRATEISEISRGLKSLAKELEVPVIALSQLNRGVEQRPSKRPMMSDLRESGSIEQDADMVVFLYRDEYYHEDSRDKGLAEVIIAKQRNGPTGTIKAAFLQRYTRFENYIADQYLPEGYA